MCRHPDEKWLRAKEGEPLSVVAIDEKDFAFPEVVMLVCANCNFVRFHSTHGLHLDTSAPSDS